jgi:hypothetical protein
MSNKPHPFTGISKQEYREQWHKRVAGWRASGLSRAEYANKNGFSRELLTDWIRRFETPAARIIPVQTPTASPIKLTHHSTTLEWTQPPPAAWLAQLLKGLA